MKLQFRKANLHSKLESKLKSQYSIDFSLYYHLYSVTRSKAALLRNFKIRDCHVAIERSIPLDALNWLMKTGPTTTSMQHAISKLAAPGSSTAAEVDLVPTTTIEEAIDPEAGGCIVGGKPQKIVQRRGTVSGTCVFSVDGKVTDVGANPNNNTFNPFEKPKNIPFALCGRRRSVDGFKVMSTIPEHPTYADVVKSSLSLY